MRKMIMALSAAAALLTLGSTAAQASVPSNTPDATPACGMQCFDLSSLLLGRHVIQNAYIHGGNGRVGQYLNLKTASNSNPNQDFTGAQVGTLGAFCGSLIAAKSYVCINYPISYPVYESDWSPYGNDSGLCVGLAIAGISGEPATLQDCGATSTTLWVGDLANATIDDGHLYTPWVNASDPNFSHPLVLTVGPDTGRPSNQLRVQRLNLLTGHVVPDSQDFTLKFGPVA